MSRGRDQVEVGDRFRRPGTNRRVYTVAAIVEPYGHLPHARLVPEDAPHQGALLVAIETLGRDKPFIPVGEAP